MPRRARVDTTTESFSSKFSTRIFSTSRRHLRVGLEQRNRSVPERPQALIDGLQQVVGLLFQQHDVRIANDSKQVGALDTHARKQLRQVEPNDVLEKGECLARHGPTAPGESK